MGSYQSRVGPYSNMIGVLIKRREGRDTGRRKRFSTRPRRRDSEARAEAEAEGLQLQAMGSRGLLASRAAQREAWTTFPEPSGRARLCRHPDVRLAACRPVTPYMPVVLSHLVCGSLP